MSTNDVEVDKICAKIDTVLRSRSHFRALPKAVNHLRTTLAIAKLFLPQTTTPLDVNSTLLLKDLYELVLLADSCFHTVSKRPLQAFLFGVAHTKQLEKVDEDITGKLHQLLGSTNEALDKFEALMKARPKAGGDDFLLPSEACLSKVAMLPRWRQLGVVVDAADCDEQLLGIQDCADTITANLELNEGELASLKWITDDLRIQIAAHPEGRVRQLERDAALQQIYASDTMDDFEDIYLGDAFQNAMQALRALSHRTHEGHSVALEDSQVGGATEAEPVWARDFVLDFCSDDRDPSIDDLYADYCLLRRFIWELHQRCHSPDNTSITKGSILKVFKAHKLHNIVSLILSIDRANTLHNVGEHWVSPTVVKDDPTWQARMQIDRQSTMIDKRYVWLASMAGLSENSLLSPTNRPHPQTEEAAAVVVDAEVTVVGEVATAAEVIPIS